VFAIVGAVAASLSLSACEPQVGAYQATVQWRTSTALGLPYRKGRLRAGVQLPAEGLHHVTFDPVRDRTPNRPWRRWGTDRLVRTVMCIAEDYRREHPDWPRMVVGDLSRPKGGTFGPRFGGLGHSSHQNGLDVDVYYPRWDGRESAPDDVGDIDLERSQALVDRFVAAGATAIYVGPNTGLADTSRRRIVRVLRHHDDHMHVRIARSRARAVPPPPAMPGLPPPG
jgi:murein endopeptidase